MHLCVDASSFVMRSAGVKNYVHHWLTHVARQAGPGDRVTAFPLLPVGGALDHDRSHAGWFGTKARLAALLSANVLPGAWLDALTLGADVVHLSNQVRRVPWRARVTATLYDFTAWRVPEFHTAATIRAEHGFARTVLPRAARLLAISESTKRDAVELLGLEPDRIRVAYPGVPEAFFLVDDTAAAAAQERLGLRAPYVLCVGTVEPRKNVDTLLGAWASLTDDARQGHELVIAGPAGWRAPDTLARLRGGLPSVRYLGYVPEKLLPGLTHGATAFAYPSHYEGFGFPVAQAMACGVAGVTAENSSLPEVAGEGVLVVEGRSAAALGGALERLLADAALRQRLGAAGRARAADWFRWERCARESWEWIRGVV